MKSDAHVPKCASLRCTVLMALAGCSACAAPAPVVTGTPRARIEPAAVVVYPLPPPKFEEIAYLNASSRTVLAPGGAQAFDKLVGKLKLQASRLGANGLILENVEDARTFAFGTGVGNDTYTHNASISLGLGAVLGVYTKIGEGRAIYVPSDTTNGH
jgi:hypothetical protein